MITLFYFILATFLNFDVKEWIIENDLLVDRLKVSVMFLLQAKYFHLLINDLHNLNLMYGDTKQSSQFSLDFWYCYF